MNYPTMDEVNQREAQRLADYLQALPVNDDGHVCCPKCGTVADLTRYYCKPCCDRETRDREAREAIVQQCGRIKGGFRACSAGAPIRENHTGFVGQNVGGLPQWPWARFANDAFVKLANPKILEAVRTWTPADGSMLLLGETGSGKTAALVAWVVATYEHALEAAKLGTVEPVPEFFFVTALDLLTARRSFPLGEGEPPALLRARKCEILILDELGPETTPDLVFEIIDARHKRGAVTVATSGQTEKGFITKYGAAMFRRLTAPGVLVDTHTKAAKSAPLRAVEGAR